jgi:hypothetical protein
MRVLQWNMQITERNASTIASARLELLSEALQQLQPDFVFLQEADSRARRMLDVGYECAEGPKRIVTLWRKGQYVSQGSWEATQRAQLTLLDPSFLLLNVHLPVLHCSKPKQRSAGGHIREELILARGQHAGRREVHGGDYNMPPHDELLVMDSGFYANRCLEYALKSGIDISKKRLFNCSWKVYGGDCGALGTYYSGDCEDGPWNVPDQIFLDPQIVGNGIVEVRVITTVAEHSLMKRTGTPGGRGSDHFPLFVSVGDATS